MALDGAMLSGSAPVAVRIYRWDPPGLSLGRFQREADFADVQGPHRIVRRITGGGAIYHAEEVTFALCYDEERLPVPIDESYRIVHAAVQQALAEVGARTMLVTGGKGCCARPRERWCFAVPGRHDLVTPAGKKVVGSAQRRIRVPRPRVLHHGSIVLRVPEQTPFCGAVEELVAELPEPDALERLLESRLGALLR
jgi:lipoate-protein ligase A